MSKIINLNEFYKSRFSVPTLNREVLGQILRIPPELELNSEFDDGKCIYRVAQLGKPTQTGNALKSCKYYSKNKSEYKKYTRPLAVA